MMVDEGQDALLAAVVVGFGQLEELKTCSLPQQFKTR
jgi:hypothetical protein